MAGPDLGKSIMLLIFFGVKGVARVHGFEFPEFGRKGGCVCARRGSAGACYCGGDEDQEVDCCSE